MLDTSTNIFPAYQGGAFAASRKWAAANPEALKGYIRGYLAGLEWTLDPANREEATQIMLHVHQKGVGICGVYTYEIAETKVTQTVDYARKNQHPLQCTLEKE